MELDPYWQQRQGLYNYGSGNNSFDLSRPPGKWWSEEPRDGNNNNFYLSRPPDKSCPRWSDEPRDGFLSLLQWYCYWLGVNPAACCQLPEVVMEEIIRKALLGSSLTTVAEEREVLPPPAGPPHEAFRYVVHYLGLKELLCLEMVCKPLLEVVRREAPLWQNLRVDPPLDLKLTDTALLSLALRAQGRLQSLMLANCQRLSDASLEMVVAANTKLTRLDVSSCKGLTIEAVVKLAQRHTLPGYERFRRMRIEGVNNTTKEHIQQLRAALCPDKCWPPFYRLLHSGYGDRVLDVEACPKCGLLRAVYDCWRKKCHEKWSEEEQRCRGCLSCIKRCDNCGGCFENGDYEETFALENMCLKCSREPIETKFPGTGFGSGLLSFNDQKVVEENWRLQQQQQQEQEEQQQQQRKQAAAMTTEMRASKTGNSHSCNENKKVGNVFRTDTHNYTNTSINDSFVGRRQ